MSFSANAQFVHSDVSVSSVKAVAIAEEANGRTQSARTSLQNCLIRFGEPFRVCRYLGTI